MTTTEADRLVHDYLRRLETAASELPRGRRDELVDEIREHLDAALADAEPDDELAVRNALERLGPPEEIVRAAGDTTASPARPRTPWLEIAALVALVIPIGGWIAGIVLVTVSRIWSAREKLLGIFLAVVPPLLLFLTYNVGSGGGGTGIGELQTGDDIQALSPQEQDDGGGDNALLQALGIFLVFLFAIPGLVSALYLGWRLRRHNRRAEALGGAS